MANKLVEYKGEMRTLYEIAKIEQISYQRLIRNYSKNGNIYESVNLSKEDQRAIRGNKIEYNGQMLTIYAIAKIEGIAEPKLRIVYSKIGNIYDAVKHCKSHIIQKIEYEGLELSLKAIATEENLCSEILRRNFKETGDINKAIELTKQTTRKKFEYNGEELTLTEIAKLEGIGRITLKKYYDLLGNIYEAVDVCNANLRKKSEKIETKTENEEQEEMLTLDATSPKEETTEYNGEELPLIKIAQNERVSLSKLSELFEELKDINKAIFAAKFLQRQEQKVNIEQAEVKLYDIAILIGVKPMILINLLNEGISIEEIKNKYQNQEPAENIRLSNSQTLLEYCVKNKLDFTFFYRGTVTYKRKAAEVITLCKKRNTDIPMEWIYETYGQSFKKIETSTPQDAAIIYDLRKKRVSLDETLESCTIRKYARKNGLDIEWGEALYSLIKMREILGMEFHSEIIINDVEKQFIDECETELLELRRKLQDNAAPMQNKKQQEDITRD